VLFDGGFESYLRSHSFVAHTFQTQFHPTLKTQDGSKTETHVRTVFGRGIQEGGFSHGK